MRSSAKLAVIAGIVALGALPAVAVAAAGPHPSRSTQHTIPSQAKAYGKLCQSESKQHVAGTPGTPFSKCVADLAKLANGSATNLAKACKDESTKHVAGQSGTPFSACVREAKKFLRLEAGG